MEELWDRQRNNDVTRKLDGLKLDEISETYRMIHNQVKVGQSYDNFFQNYAQHQNDLMDAVDHDEFLLKTNLTALGQVLNEFLTFLVSFMGFKETIDQAVADSTKSERNVRRMDGTAANAFERTHDNFRKWTTTQSLAIILSVCDGEMGEMNEAKKDVLKKARLAFVEFFSQADLYQRYMFFALSYPSKVSLRTSADREDDSFNFTPPPPPGATKKKKGGNNKKKGKGKGKKKK